MYYKAKASFLEAQVFNFDRTDGLLIKALDLR